MKPGLSVGRQAMVEVTVTPEMFPQFEGKTVHPVFSTVAMIYYMEWASRKIILPYLEDHEEGIGGAVSVKHVAPSPESSRVTVTATVVEVRENAVITRVEASNHRGLIGKGEVVQYILPKEEIWRKIEEAKG